RAGEGRVELLKVVPPVLILDVDRPPGVVLLELLVHRSDQVRPAGLRVDLKPAGQLVGLRPVRIGARRRRDDSERNGSDCRNENSRSHPRLLEPSTRDLAVLPLWPAGGCAMVGAPIGLYQLATPPVISYRTGSVKGRLALRPAELGDDPVAVAAVHRLDVLDGLPVVVAARPLEEESRRVERH